MAKNNITYTTSYNPYNGLSMKAMDELTAGHYEIDYRTGGISWVADKPKTEDKGVEEWVWVTGYKGTDKDMKCRDYQYEMHKQHDMPDGSEINICHSGFHFCDKPLDVFRYYRLEQGNRFFEVKALVRRWNKNGQYTIEHEHGKMVAKSIEFVRELTTEEIFKHLGDPRTTEWTIEDKNHARQTSVNQHYDFMHAKKLMEFGYSEAFATWVVKKGAYDFAFTMGSMPDVSMDVKVMSICMYIYD